jgi:protein O-GlcNAc transferase
MKPERNDPCPCGSGKKYKKCCGANVSQQIAVAPAVLAGQAAAAFQRGDFAVSIELARKLLQTDPSNAQANHILGLSLMQTRQLRPAITHLEKALRQEPRNPFLLNNLAFACHGAGDVAVAERYARKALEVDAQLPDAYNNLGQILVDTGQINAAIAAYRQAVTLQPDSAVFQYNLGAALHQHKKDRVEAERCYRQALALHQDFAPALANLGALMLDEERWSEARALLERAVVLSPGDPKTLNSLGLAQLRLKDEEGALSSFKKAIDLSEYPAAYVNLGVLLEDRGDNDGAVEAYRHILSKHPDMRDVTVNLFKLFYRSNRYEEAYALAITTPVLDSIRLGLRSMFVSVLQGVCDHARMANEWAVTRNFFEIQLQKVASDAEHDDIIVTADMLNIMLLPMNYGGSYPESQIYDYHTEWGRLTQMATKPGDGAGPTPQSPDAGRIRLAYLSADFRHHPVGFFMRQIIAAHDHSKFEVFCYFLGEGGDDLTELFRRSADHFVEVGKLKDPELAERIRADRIDVLIDLSSHTRDGRLHVLARRLAPVQIQFLGYPNTSGAGFVDYWITDPHAHAQDDVLHTEKLLRLPESFLCFGSFEERPLLTQTPAVANGYLTFGSFNNLRKLSAETVDLWASLLRAVPNSRLLLKDRLFEGKFARANVIAAFSARGIGRERLRLEQPVNERTLHLDQYNKMDIALDPVPYNGTTTSCEALWMGVPLLTLVGQPHRQRVSYSLLKNIGVEDTIAWSEDDYVGIAMRLAKDLPALSGLRQHIARSIRGSILCDPPRYTRQFETTLRRAWDEYCANTGQPAAAER